MKPTFQISRPTRQSGAARPLHQQNKLPVTDWSFQISAPDVRSGAMPFHPGTRQATRAPGFHTLSQRFFSVEANRDARLEGAIFGAIAALAAWPIAVAVQTALGLIK